MLETNIVATATFSVTVSGISFGTQVMTASNRVGTSSCQTTMWVSGTSAACHMSLGVGTSLAVQATVSAVAGTQTAVFTYDGDAAAFLPGSIQRAGANLRGCFFFCARGLAPFLKRRAAAHGRPIVALHDDADGGAAPVVSFVAEANSAVTSGYSVTVSGLNFGVSTTTPTATVGLSSCATAAWASTSSVVCMLSMGEGVEHELRATVAGVVGSRTATFSYDGKQAAGHVCGTCGRGDHALGVDAEVAIALAMRPRLSCMGPRAEALPVRSTRGQLRGLVQRDCDCGMERDGIWRELRGA
jgi:hypothetical protein